MALILSYLILSYLILFYPIRDPVCVMALVVSALIVLLCIYARSHYHYHYQYHYHYHFHYHYHDHYCPPLHICKVPIFFDHIDNDNGDDIFVVAESFTSYRLYHREVNLILIQEVVWVHWVWKGWYEAGVDEWAFLFFFPIPKKYKNIEIFNSTVYKSSNWKSDVIRQHPSKWESNEFATLLRNKHFATYHR